MDYPKIKEFKKDLELTNKDIARITGHTHRSIHNMLQPRLKIPRWMNLVLHVWKKSRLKQIKELMSFATHAGVQEDSTKDLDQFMSLIESLVISHVSKKTKVSFEDTGVYFEKFKTRSNEQ